jgi:hypothetical protein
MAMRCLLTAFTAGLLMTATAAEKPRIYVTESGTPQLDAKGALQFAGGSSPQNVEVMKAFSQHCSGVVVTANREKADFIVRLDHEEPNPTTLFTYGNKVAVFNKSEDLIYTGHTHLLGAAVKAACTALTSAH